MANEKLHLVHVKSATKDKAPDASNLIYGEIAVNYNVDSPALYIKDSTNQIVKFGSGPYAGSPTDGGPSYKTFGIPFGDVDTGSTSTVITATVDNFPTELTDGVCAYIRNNVVSSAKSFTLNVNGTGAKPVYATNADATRVETVFSASVTYLFIYNSKRVSGGCWDMYYGYNSNTDVIGITIRTNSMTLPSASKFGRYRLMFTSADGEHFVPANASTSTGATSAKATTQIPIDPFGSIRYYASSTSGNTGTNPSVTTLYEQYSGVTLGYSFNRTGAALTLTAHKPVYVKCAPQSNGSAIIDEEVPYVQDLPTTEDGKIYIYLGVATSATAIEFPYYHPVYYYKDGAIRIWTSAPEQTIDTELDTGSTNPLANSAITTYIYDIEKVVSAALNDLNNRKADKSYVDEAVSSITIDVDSELDTGSTNPVANSAITKVISEDEKVISAAFNDLESRKADKTYVDDAVSSITIDVDSELDSASTNPVENRAIWEVIVENEEVISAAFNDLETRKADKSYVDTAVSSITIDVDSELDTGSTNPVSNSAITTYIYDIEEVTSAALNDLNNRKADKSYVDEAVSSITIDVDSELDSASTNPVENQVIWSAMTEMEFVTTMSLNDLNDRLEDVESEISDDVEMKSNKISDISYPHVSGSTDTNTYPTAKAAYNEIHPKVKTSIPSGGFEPNIMYKLGTVTGTKTFTLKTTGIDTSIANHYHFMFNTSSLAPTITWPSQVTSWVGNCLDTSGSPVLSINKRYEISIVDGNGVIIEF